MNFVDTISSWINRHFSNEEAIYLVLLIVFIFGFLAVFGSYLAPVITGLIVAFLIQGIVVRLVLWGLPEVFAIGVVMILFLGALVALFVGVLPLVWRQMNQTIDAMPGVIDRIAELFTDLSATYPALFSEETVSAWLSTANAQLTWEACFYKRWWDSCQMPLGLSSSFCWCRFQSSSFSRTGIDWWDGSVDCCRQTDRYWTESAPK